MEGDKIVTIEIVVEELEKKIAPQSQSEWSQVL